MSGLPERVVSGGQTGVDRGALDAALDCGVPHGGWCPRGRLAEDGRIPARHELEETSSASYAERTRLNVRDSDGTLILATEPLRGGTALTLKLARELGKPCLVAAVDVPSGTAAVREWLAEHRIRVLNVAGPRESGAPGIAEQAREFITSVLSGHA